MDYSKDTRSTRMLTRSNSSVSKRSPDDPQVSAIRFDYSDVHLENEELDYELEDRKYLLHRARQKASIDSEVNIKTVKKSADAMLSLKEAVQKRNPNESSKKILKSADFRKRSSKPEVKVLDVNSPEESKESSRKSSTDMVDGFHFAEPRERETRQKPINTLTMFLLSLQSLKRNRPTSRGDDRARERREKKEDISNAQTLRKPNITSLLHPDPQPLYGRRPATVHTTRYRNPSGAGGDDGHSGESDGPIYGIHVQTDFTRSRRKLEEISRLEQDAKYGYVDKYEQRRRRLLTTCKDTSLLDLRIQRFLKNVDEFKKVNSPDNSLDRILLRSKSAMYRRDLTST